MNIAGDIQTVLIAHFRERGWPEHVNEQKLRDRFSFEGNDTDQTYVAKIERHRPALGATYTKGLKMSAFQTYFMRYEVNLETKAVRELPIQYLPVESSHIDLGAMVSEALEWDYFYLKVSPIDDGKFLIQETVSNAEAIVDNLDEAIDFARARSEGITDYFDMQMDMQLSEGYSDEQIGEIKAEYARLLDEALAEKAREAWERDVDGE